MKRIIFLIVIGLIALEIAERQPDVESAPPAPVVRTEPEVGIPATAPESAAEPDWKACVFPVRQVNGREVNGGTAISLGNGLLVTAAHVVSGGSYPEVEVNGQWQRAGFTRISGKDVAYLTISDTSLPSVETRPAEYGENVYVYGLKTQRVMCGRVSDNDMASLLPNEGGVEQGDSGGGVFSEDGKLVGTIRAHRGKGGNYEANPRVVLFETVYPPKPYSANSAPQAAAAVPSGPTPSCANGQCQYSVKQRPIFSRK